MNERKRHNYKNLKIWSLGIEIADTAFKLSKFFPEDERFGLTSQVNRCAISIPSNIAEGSSRLTKSFSHFIDISLGSSYELETQLILALNRKYLNKNEFIQIEEKIQKFLKMTSGFQNNLN